MIQALHDNVFVKPIEQQGVTLGGIIIPETAQERPMLGEVLAAASEYRTAKGKVKPMPVRAGDVVVFPRNAGDRLSDGKDEIFVLREKDLFAVIKR